MTDTPVTRETLEQLCKRAAAVMSFHAGRCPLHPNTNYSGCEEHLAEYRSVIKEIDVALSRQQPPEPGEGSANKLREIVRRAMYRDSRLTKDDCLELDSIAALIDQQAAELAKLQTAFEEQKCPECGRHRPYCDCLDSVRIELAKLPQIIDEVTISIATRHAADLTAARAECERLRERVKELEAKGTALMGWDNNALDDPACCAEYKKAVSDLLEILPAPAAMTNTETPIQKLVAAAEAARAAIAELGAPFYKVVGRGKDDEVLYAVIVVNDPLSAYDIVSAVEEVERQWEEDEESEE